MTIREELDEIMKRVVQLKVLLVDGIKPPETLEILNKAEQDYMAWKIENGLAEPADEENVREGAPEEPEDFSGATYIEGTNNER